MCVFLLLLCFIQVLLSFVCFFNIFLFAGISLVCSSFDLSGPPYIVCIDPFKPLFLSTAYRYFFCFLILNISKWYSHLFLVSVVRLNSTFLQFKDCLIGFLSIFLALLKRLYNFPFYLSKGIVYILHGWVISHCGYFSVFLLTSRSVLKLLKGELLNVKSSLTL